jgi:hypothetical protein
VTHGSGSPTHIATERVLFHPLVAHVVGAGGPVPVGRLLLVGAALAALNLGIMLILQGRAERAARRDDDQAPTEAPPTPRDRQQSPLAGRLIAADRRQFPDDAESHDRSPS